MHIIAFLLPCKLPLCNWGMCTYSGIGTYLHTFWPQLWEQCPVRIQGIMGQDLSVPKSNRLHVVIFWFSFITLRRILHLPPFKTMGNFSEVLNFNRLFFKLDRFICNYIVLCGQCGLPFKKLCIVIAFFYRHYRVLLIKSWLHHGP